MSMKEHILMAMREVLERWDDILGKTSEEQITSPDFPSNWSIKDVIVHLWIWQQRSIARMEAALEGREPVFPEWVPGLVPETEGVNDRINAWIFETYRNLTWPEAYQNWSNGFLHFLKLGESFSERDLLDSDKYLWMEGYSLADVYLSSYDHHQEHIDMLFGWLREPGERE
ncbi:MAG: ClbS/DfsB family four-helix bundle protein [Chloroflexi bacterium]|nr:MAG: ClbS/DfsB family four-helix bundle protein [Chloroflexota bacterium]